MEKKVVKYDINEAAIAKMADIYMGLTISDLENEDEFNQVHAARMIVKGHRVRVDKDVKKQNDIANSFKKKVKADAKPLYDGLEPIESHLSAEEKKVTDEQKRLEEEEDRKEREKIQARIDELQEYDMVKSFFDVAALTNDEYDTILDKAIVDYQEEQERITNERLDQEAEKKRLADQKEKQDREDLANQVLGVQREWYDTNILGLYGSVTIEKLEGFVGELTNKVHDGGHSPELRELLGKQYSSAPAVLAQRKNQDRKDKEQVAAQDKIDEANRKIDADLKALEDAKREEMERKDKEGAAVIAKKVAEEWAEELARKKIAREEQDRKGQEEADRIEAARQEALKPDKEKLIAWAKTFSRKQSFEAPVLENAAANLILTGAIKDIEMLLEEVIEQAEKL